MTGAAARVDLSMPARPDSLQLVRLSAGFVAARADLVYDDVQDLRLAIDELCVALLSTDDDDGRRLSVRYTWDDEAIEVTCTVAADDGSLVAGTGVGDAGGHSRLHDADETWQRMRFQPGDISRQILDALVDDHAVTTGPGRRVGWLRKRRIGVTH
jgi:hypothetical protein